MIGSSCIGASVIGGICNNSGGSLVQRGPAYTEMSLFARIDEQGKLQLVNHLGIDLGHTPEQILSKLDDERIKDEDVRHAWSSCARSRLCDAGTRYQRRYARPL
ncbi:D-lactate dehydrogenase [Salmonella enterica subsp. enterica]|uniref:D-lactate dehydrogenase n=1 Tax=Salmonella enterica I TaxID=59201 RepID=A0A3S4F303_SALET|nr:D-lactate dehydrogenase [Salmonella enterica subsp. enterica]